jgi:hypothetical protein
VIGLPRPHPDRPDQARQQSPVQGRPQSLKHWARASVVRATSATGKSSPQSIPPSMAVIAIPGLPGEARSDIEIYSPTCQ